MDSPVDIEAFRHAIGHDAEAERLLLRLFLETMDEVFARLHPAMPAASWAAELHLMKGAALNVRAAGLVEAAQAAHALKDAPQEQKQAVLAQLSAVYSEIKNQITPLVQ